MLVILIIVAILVILIWSTRPKIKKHHIPSLVLLLLVILTLTGRLHWITLASSILPLFLALWRWNKQDRSQKMTHQQALDTLGINKKNPSKEEVRLAYKKKASQSHPDKGGDVDQFKQLGVARDLLLK